MKNGGQGAPLTPIFHNLLVLQNKINLPVVIVNLGGIANYTFIQEYVVAPHDDDEFKENYITSGDSGPGNCLIDQWIRKNSNKLYDKDGKIALLGKINKKIVDRVIDSLVIKDSYESHGSVLYLIQKKLTEVSFELGLGVESHELKLHRVRSNLGHDLIKLGSRLLSSFG